ncbi:hypothetical protein ACQKE0_01715 [Shewanella colwelliana]|uniref:hypothetical protein n=1 Tax=Shewanella colwelliana TaxID=23 RepID=UPI003D06CB72
MNTFTTRQGTVSISAPFWSMGNEHKQVELTYRPDNYHGWGVSKAYNANRCSDFSQADAELFALNAESKLRINGGKT